MRKLVKLTWLEIKLKFGLTNLMHLKSGSKKDIGKTLGYGLLMVFAIAMLMGMYLYILDIFFDAGAFFGPQMQGAVLTLMLSAGMLVVLVFGLFYCMGMYYSKDMEFLATLPIPKRTAFASKFIPAIMGEIGVFALLALPPIILFAVKSGAGVLYWIEAICVLIFGPMIPFAISAIIAALLMRVSIISRYKDKIAIVGGFLLFVAYFIGVQYLSRFMTTADMGQIVALLSGGMMEFIGKICPPALWAAEALTGVQGLNILLFLGVSILAFLLAWVVGGSGYLRGALAQGETAKKARQINLEKSSVRSSRAKAVFIKEWKTILRSPIYAMNSLMSVILGPLMVFVLFMMPASGDADMQEFQSLFSMMQANEIILTGMIISAFMMFVAAINTAASTVYSREGDCVWIALTTPIDARTLARAKALFGWSLSALGSLITVVFMLLATGMGAAVLLLGLALAWIGSTPGILFSVWLDMKKPKLIWESEQKAMKSNFNSVVSMLLSMVYIGVMVILAIWLGDMGMGIAAICGVLVVVNIAVTAGLYALLMKCAQKYLQRMGSE